ncbi:MAG TPA: heme-binding protein [Candidatus Eisenbergiella merdipullorum]|uniref:Heme-binding protein n=1 Tax=Candidatus Eisenbergiella merdipullorum TaxID=2838553 RepID=A0A9D2I5C0_9FIRM|nr:heme-binding protein [Candidatus Eisenbergiella merdipullorum]
MDEKGIAEAVRKALAQAGYPACPKKAEGNRAPVSMTLRLAEELAARVEKKALEWDMRVVTAIADEGGNTKLVRSMDGAYIGSVDVAVNKAYTCVAFRMSTQKLSELARPDGPLYGIQHTNGGRIVIFGGGEPLAADGSVIGALGVSGGTAEQDTALAAYGASLLKEVISCL